MEGTLIPARDAPLEGMLYWVAIRCDGDRATRRGAHRWGDRFRDGFVFVEDHGAASGHDTYTDFRHRVGRALLLGLEILVAADIIRTVVLEPTLANVLVLGLLVLIRTFLSWSLVLEIEERWPWQAHRAAEKTSGVASFVLVQVVQNI